MIEFAVALLFSTLARPRSPLRRHAPDAEPREGATPPAS